MFQMPVVTLSLSEKMKTSNRKRQSNHKCMNDIPSPKLISELLDYVQLVFIVHIEQLRTKRSENTVTSRLRPLRKSYVEALYSNTSECD